jgi:uncharacterized protein (TIGR00266 family)
MFAAIRAAKTTAQRNPRGFLQRRQESFKRIAAVAVCQNCRPLSSSSASSEITVQNENLPSKLIDFSISSKIEGEESQIATVKLRPNETLRAESGAMLYMTEGVEMDTSLQNASSAFSRMMTGQNMFLSDFKYTGDKEGTVGLGTAFPSKILRLSLQDYENSTLICQRGAYLASNPSVDIQMEFTKSLSAGFFGGQGFILQRLSGQGDVLVKAGGTLVEKYLSEGETLRVTSGSIVAFTSTVNYDIQMMPGIKNAMFGGEGLFVTTLKGPGKIWLQGMPADRMIAEIARRMPSGGLPIGFGMPLGGVGGGGEAGADASGVESGVGDAAAVAATDEAAIEADRQASGMMGGGDVDGESPSALYGDAVQSSSAPTPEQPPASPFEDDFGQETTFSDESTFTDETTFADEQSFSDDNSFSSGDNDQQQQDMFEDSTTTDFFESGDAGDASDDAGGGIFSTLWDIFTGGDD